MYGRVNRPGRRNPSGGECLEGEGDSAEGDLRLLIGSVPRVQGRGGKRQAHPPCVAGRAVHLERLQHSPRKIPYYLPLACHRAIPRCQPS